MLMNLERKLKEFCLELRKKETKNLEKILISLNY